IKKSSGRNNTGRVTVRGQAGGATKLYRLVDFKRNKKGVPAQVLRLEYDPNRTAFIALIEYQDDTKEKSYIIAPAKLKVGDVIISDEKTDILPGNCALLKNIPVGTTVHNI